jgi:hypothetical protein
LPRLVEESQDVLFNLLQRAIAAARWGQAIFFKTKYPKKPILEIAPGVDAGLTLFHY